MSDRLNGKVALITGTGGGQGRAAAILFAREGAKVVGCDLKVEGAEETVAMARAAGGEMVSMHPVDLSDTEQVKKWIGFAIKTYGRFEILYNNAASGKFETVDRMTDADWHFTVRNELDLVYLTCHYAWPYLKKSGNSVILNTASIAGIVGSPWLPDVWDKGAMFAHCATKGGVRALTRELALQGGPLGIRVIAICPGVVEAEKGSRQSEVAWVPLGRTATPEDIAKLALFLASDESAYITGTDIVIDGGITAH